MRLTRFLVLSRLDLVSLYTFSVRSRSLLAYPPVFRSDMPHFERGNHINASKGVFIDIGGNQYNTEIYCVDPSQLVTNASAAAVTAAANGTNFFYCEFCHS